MDILILKKNFLVNPGKSYKSYRMVTLVLKVFIFFSHTKKSLQLCSSHIVSFSAGCAWHLFDSFTDGRIINYFYDLCTHIRIAHKGKLWLRLNAFYIHYCIVQNENYYHLSHNTFPNDVQRCQIFTLHNVKVLKFLWNCLWDKNSCEKHMSDSSRLIETLI